MILQAGTSGKGEAISRSNEGRSALIRFAPTRAVLDPITDASYFALDTTSSNAGAPGMAKRQGSGDWLLLEEKLERGDASFVDDLRALSDAASLAGFAARWYADKRPASRRLLLDYLDRPLNAFRHEPLVKRLFKQAEGAGDDEVMARFMVLFDRSIRRQEKRRVHGETAHRQDAN